MEDPASATWCIESSINLLNLLRYQLDSMAWFQVDTRYHIEAETFDRVFNHLEEKITQISSACAGYR